MESPNIKILFGNTNKLADNLLNKFISLLEKSQTVIEIKWPKNIFLLRGVLFEQLFDWQLIEQS